MRMYCVKNILYAKFIMFDVFRDVHLVKCE